jgi:hypothetical protein
MTPEAATGDHPVPGIEVIAAARAATRLLEWAERGTAAAAAPAGVRGTVVLLQRTPDGGIEAMGSPGAGLISQRAPGTLVTDIYWPRRDVVRLTAPAALDLADQAGRSDRVVQDEALAEAKRMAEGLRSRLWETERLLAAVLHQLGGSLNVDRKTLVEVDYHRAIVVRRAWIGDGSPGGDQVEVTLEPVQERGR